MFSSENDPRLPTEPTTPEQWRVIVWASIVLLVIVGCVGLWFSLDPPAGKAGVAAQIRSLSFVCFGVAAGIYAAKRIADFLLR